MFVLELISYRWLRLLIAISLLVPLIAPLNPQAAIAAGHSAPTQTPDSDLRLSDLRLSNLHLEETAGGIEIRWELPGAATGNASDVWQAGFEFQPADDYLLPTHTFVVTPRDATTAAQIRAEIHQLSTEIYSEAAHGELMPAPSMIPNALDYTPPAYLDPVQTPPLPQSPLFILRATSVRGQPEIIIGFSPIFQDPNTGRLTLATALAGQITHATLPAAAARADIAQIDEVFGAAALGLEAAVPPINPWASRTAWKITVAQAGIQELRAADLAAAGLENPEADGLAIFRNGQEIALHILDSNGNEHIDGANDALRFYAPSPGDRWNQTDTYWLVQRNQSGKRMNVIAPPTSDAPIRTTAYAEGVWRQPKLYNSNLAGPSGDAWFHLDAVAQSGVSAAERSFQANIAPMLRLAADSELTATVRVDSTLYRLEGSNFSNITHTVRFDSGDGATVDRDYFYSTGGGALNVEFASELAAPTPSLAVTFLGGERPLAVLFDRVHWRQPVNLDFQIDGQNRGATFTSVEGEWRYRLRNLPNAARVYDVTEPHAPRIRQMDSAGDDRLLAVGLEPGRFVVSGPGTIHTPQIAPHTPSDLAEGNNSGNGAQALYIAPAEFHATLEPLVEHRREQDYSVAVVDVQHIYDAWSYGQVSPDAIRNFLRHAVAAWQPAPISVVMVGDGTHDPHSYLGHDNPNVIPPYMAPVDPWLREVACDSCYGKLEGDHPLDTDAFAMDIWVGRFPVINTTELRNVVNKILRYETATDGDAPWRRISVQITDDYFFPEVDADGRRVPTDRAGDFVASAESINALKPPTIDIRRNYYNIELSQAQRAQLAEISIHNNNDDNANEGDPAADAAQTKLDLYEAYLPWYTHDADEAWQQSIRLMNQGAGLVTYTGHANHWKWASTMEDSEHNHLFGLWDVLQLNNRDALFIGLSMTCYTSQFTEPAPSHFTLDEHLLLRPNGGAVAVWGPAGLSVVHGHDILQIGFHQKLWQAEPMTARMGELLEAGYAQIRQQACCQDVLKTFLLLGDPLMPARVNPNSMLFSPTVERAE